MSTAGNPSLENIKDPGTFIDKIYIYVEYIGCNNLRVLGGVENLIHIQVNNIDLRNRTFLLIQNCSFLKVII